jgi:hypothetical protein
MWTRREKVCPRYVNNPSNHKHVLVTFFQIMFDNGFMAKPNNFLLNILLLFILNTKPEKQPSIEYLSYYPLRRFIRHGRPANISDILIQSAMN